MAMTIIFQGLTESFMKRQQMRRDCLSNQIWLKWVENQGDTIETYHSCVADESKRGFRRTRFESWLMEQGCYLEVKNGVPEIKGFDEQSLMMFLLKYA